MNAIIWKYLDRQAKKEIIRLKERVRELENVLAEEIEGQNIAVEKLCNASEELLYSDQYAELLKTQMKMQSNLISDMRKELINLFSECSNSKTQDNSGYVLDDDKVIAYVRDNFAIEDIFSEEEIREWLNN